MSKLLWLLSFIILASCGNNTETQNKLGATLAPSALCPTDSVGKTPIRDTIIPITTTTYKDTTIIFYTKDSVWIKGNKKPHWQYSTSKHTQTIKDTIITTTYPITQTVPRDTVYIVMRPCPPLPETKFGAKIQGENTDIQIITQRKLGSYCVRPNMISMDLYAGGTPNSLDKYHRAGFFCIINVNAVNTAGDNIVEYLHGADTIAWKRQFDRFCNDNKWMKDSGIVCIENEPINTKYYKGDFNNYINELRMAIEIASKYGIKVVSGAEHLQLIDLVRKGTTGDIRITNTKALLTAEKTLKVAYINTHDNYAKDAGGYKCPDIPATVAWIRTFTGKDVMNNEVSMVGATPAIGAQYKGFLKQAKLVYVMWWSGDTVDGVSPPNSNSKGDALSYGDFPTTGHDPSDLTNLGIAVKE